MIVLSATQLPHRHTRSTVITVALDRPGRRNVAGLVGIIVAVESCQSFREYQRH
jgi:hypothetical protein